MKIAKRDWIFIAVIVAVLGALLMSNGNRAKNVPDNEKHKPYYAAMSKGGDRGEVEKGCTSCHGSTNIPLSRAHPPKEHCLLCHKLFQAHT
jgi:hypothetical protein